ncbi:ribonuclease HII [Patescibacteria group bacterium]
MRDYSKYKYIIGIDEVGRGPIAGPVAVGCVLYKKEEEEYLKEVLLGVRDSKKLTEKKRNNFFEKIKTEKEKGSLNYFVAFVESKKIDKFGIVPSIKACIEKSISEVTKNISPQDCLVLLDGGLKASEEFKNQETIIKGDDKEMVISIASVVAKVRRDKVMCDFSLKFLDYGFEKHKGYGTKFHYEQIKKKGICQIHRLSYIH